MRKLDNAVKNAMSVTPPKPKSLLGEMDDFDESAFYVEDIAPFDREGEEDTLREFEVVLPYPDSGVLQGAAPETSTLEALATPANPASGVLNRLGPSINNISRLGEFGGGFGDANSNLRDMLRKVMRDL